MSRYAAPVWIVCLLLVVSASVPGAQEKAHRSGGIRRVRNAIPGRYLVKLRGNDDPEAVATEAALTHRGRLRHAYRHALRGFAIEISEAAALTLANDPRVEYVEEDGVTTGEAIPERTATSWGLDRIDQRSRDINGIYRYTSTGAGVNVYVIDSGVRVTHQVFGGRAFAAYSAVDDGIPADVDCNGHGTHVAGIAGGADVGVASGVTIHSVRALFCDNSGSWSDYIEAIDWVVANHRTPAVINASIGGSTITSVEDAIDRAVSAGITFVGSAGNQGDDACRYIPGSAPGAIAVGNAMWGDERSSDSNYGKCVTLYAPGSAILSADASDDFDLINRWGTSMASPHVAGAAALFLENHPRATPAEVRAALLGSATAGVLGQLTPGDSNLLLFSLPLGDRVAPTVTITSPGGGTVVSGSVHVRVVVSDDVELADVSSSVDGTPLSAASTAPFDFVWDTTRASDTSHTITADARDRVGNVTHRSVVVTVANGVNGKSGWVTGPVGSATNAGQASFAQGTLVLDAAGSDVYGTADEFFFAHRSWTGDGDIVARVAALNRPAGAQFAIAGLMFRESSAAGARQAAAILSTDGKVKFRRRVATGGTTLSDGPSAGTAFTPAWLKLSRRGNAFSAYLSADGVTWTSVYTSTTISMPPTVDVGRLALRNGGSGLARAAFNNIGIGRVPAGWSVADVGAVDANGTTRVSQDAFALEATGTDLWSSADAFHFAYTPLTGDGDIIATVDSAVAPAGSNFALAAITMRESLDASSRHASLALTSNGKAKFRRRTSTGGITASDGPSAGSITLPRWIRLTRRGQDFTASISTDGVQWQRVHTSQTVGMPSTIYAGLVALRNGGVEATNVRFSHVVVNRR